MKPLRTQKWMFWTLVIAYAALLAHAFVPHHHHGDHTAFINAKACPHGHHGDGGMHTDHGDRAHAGHQPGDPSAPSAAGDCETLKNILPTDHQLDGSDATPYELLLYTGLSFPVRLPDVAIHLVFAGSRLRWEPICPQGIYDESTGLRGPPALA